MLCSFDLSSNHIQVLDDVAAANGLSSRVAALRHILAAVAPAVAGATAKPAPVKPRPRRIDLRYIPLVWQNQFRAWREGRIDRPSDAALLGALETCPRNVLEDSFGPLSVLADRPQQQFRGGRNKIFNMRKISVAFHDEIWDFRSGAIDQPSLAALQAAVRGGHRRADLEAHFGPIPVPGESGKAFWKQFSYPGASDDFPGLYAHCVSGAPLDPGEFPRLRERLSPEQLKELGVEA